MNIQGIQPLIILTFFAASVTTIVYIAFLWQNKWMYQHWNRPLIGRIKANILGQIGTHTNIHVHHTSSCEQGMDNYYKWDTIHTSNVTDEAILGLQEMMHLDDPANWNLR